MEWNNNVAQGIVGFFMTEMPGQTLAVIITVILVPSVQGFWARWRHGKSRRSLRTMLDIHFDNLRRGVHDRDAVVLTAESAILDELLRTVAATMRPEMIGRYNDYLHDLITNQGDARELKYASGAVAHDPQRFGEIQDRFGLWEKDFTAFLKHFK